MVVIGIDLGSYEATLSAVRKGGVDVILNEASRRSTP
jgi:molecular chaperone DnaK (HSP70)